MDRNSFSRIIAIIAVAILLTTVFNFIYLVINQDALSRKVKESNQRIEELSAKIPSMIVAKDGRTPILGVDYFIPEPIPGPKGDTVVGKDGRNGNDGKSGESAYEIAVRHGFAGTEVQWLASLVVVGATGESGATPILRCNENKNRWEVKYGADASWQILNGKVTKCMFPDSTSQP